MICELTTVGPAPYRVLFVGQAPGKQENQLGSPFVGKSGSKLRGELANLGVRSYALTNAVRCWPLNDRKPKRTEIEACSGWLTQDIWAIMPEIIVPLGEVATQAVGYALENIFKGGPTMAGYEHPLVISTLHPAAVLRSPVRLGPQFLEKLALVAAYLQGQRVEAEPTEVLDWVRHLSEEEVLSHGPWAIDTETTGGLDGDLVTAQLGNPDGSTFYVQVLPPIPPHVFLHSATFDIPYLGIDPYNLDAWDDTQLMAHVLRKPSTGLKNLLRSELGLACLDFNNMMAIALAEAKAQGTKTKGREHDFSLALLTVPELATRYAAGDSQGTALLGAALSAELERDHPAQHYYRDIEKPTTPILVRARSHGILIDQDGLKESSRNLMAIHDQCVAQIHTITGEWVNVESPDLARVLVSNGVNLTELTDGGKLSTRESALLRAVGAPSFDSLADVNTYAGYLVRDVLLARECRTLDSSFATGLQNFVKEDGRIHGTIRQVGPITGRRASENPNLQQIPARSALGKPIRRCFTVPDGYVWLKMDASQLELRIFAHLVQDPLLMEGFQTGRDIHQIVADKLGITRSDAKNGVYCTVYGGGVAKFAATVGVRKEEANAFRRTFESDFRFGAYRDMVYAELLANGGTVRTVNGWRHTYGHFYSPVQSEVEDAVRSACDLKCQGTAAEILKVFSVRVDDFCRHHGGTIIVEVHDELGDECPKTLVHEVVPFLKRTFREVGYDMGITVPLELSVSSGPNWADQEDIP